MYTLSQLFNGLCILYDYLYIFVINIWFEYGECSLTKVSHYLQVLWLFHFKGRLHLYNNTLTGTIPTEMGNMNELGKLFCTCCLNSLMNFAFYMKICISLLWIYDLKLESVNWSMSHHLQVLWLSHFKGGLELSSNQLTGTLPTEMGKSLDLTKIYNQSNYSWHICLIP